MAKLKHLRHVKRGTRHVHSCPCCSRWRVKPAVCTLVECDIIGVYADCESIDPGQRFPLGGRDKVCAACEAEFAHARAIEVLHAIGEAIATVARATMIVRVSLFDEGGPFHRLFGIESRDGRVIELHTRFDCSRVYEYDSLRERFFQEGRCLREFVGAPSDVAAEAVAALIEERARVYAETAR